MNDIKRGDKVKVIHVIGRDFELGIKIGDIYTVVDSDPDGDVYIAYSEVKLHNTEPCDHPNYTDSSEHMDEYILYSSQVEVVNE